MDLILDINEIIKISGDQFNPQNQITITDIALTEVVVNPFHRFNPEIEGSLSGPKSVDFYDTNGFFNYKKALNKATLLEICVPKGYCLRKLKFDSRLVNFLILLNKPSKKTSLRYIFNTLDDQYFDLSGYIVEDYNQELYHDLRKASTNTKEKEHLFISVQDLDFVSKPNSESPTRANEVRQRYKSLFEDIIKKIITSDTSFYSKLDNINGQRSTNTKQIFNSKGEFVKHNIFTVCSLSYKGVFSNIHQSTFRDVYDEVVKTEYNKKGTKRD